MVRPGLEKFLHEFFEVPTRVPPRTVLARVESHDPLTVQVNSCRARLVSDPMELIVRTAHGTADVSIGVRDRDISLRDLIAAVTGQSAPGTARVDGRLVNASDTVAACGVLAGSVIDTLLDDPSDSTPPVTALRLLAGPGAGRRIALAPGRYRVGPGRRERADELTNDTTDLAVFDLDVTAQRVTVSPGSAAATSGPASVFPMQLGRQPLDAPQRWETEPLIVGGRVFRLEAASRPSAPPPIDMVDGFITHNRPPAIADRPRTIADAVDDALTRAPQLWNRRRSDGPLTTDLGLVLRRADGGRDRARDGADTTTLDTTALDTTALDVITLDLVARRVVAITGTPTDRAGLARSLLINLCTRYGPADLDVVIATTPADLGTWDWAKWLPHARWGSAVNLLTNDLEMVGFTQRPPERSTVVFITANQLWATATSPLRSLVLDGAEATTVIVMTDNRSTAPTSAVDIVELDGERPGAASLLRVDRAGATLEVYVPLVDVDVAADVARHLTPLLDPDRTNPTSDRLQVTFDDIVRPGDAADRWDTALGATGNPVDMAVGSVAGVAVGVDFGIDTSVVISGSSIDEAVDLATMLTMSLASSWSPAEASILLVEHGSGRSSNPIQLLPHHAGTFADRDAVAIERLLARLRTDFVGDRSGAGRLIVVIPQIDETEIAAPGLLAGLIALAAESVGVHLIAATARPLAALDASLHTLCAIEIAVDRYGGTRRATLRDRRRNLQTPFTPFDEGTIAADAIIVRPVVFGRPPSALERRLERGAQSRGDSRDRAADRAARQLRAVSEQLGFRAPRPLVPAPLPARILASELWSAHHGDGVPLGIVDAPNADEPVAYWWQPGTDGSRIFVGSPRSGVRPVLDVLLVGVADRFATADVAIYAIEHNDRRRGSIASIPHVVRAESPDHDGAVEAMLDDVMAIMHHRSRDGDFKMYDHPAVLIVARDVERLSAHASATLGHILADGGRIGVNAVVAATRPETIDPLLKTCNHIVVGALNEAHQYAGLGVARVAAIERTVGRAQLMDGTQVQLAELDAPLDSVVNALVSMIEVER